MAKSWDKIFLIVALLALAGVGVWSGFDAAAQVEELAQLSPAGTKGKSAVVLDPAVLGQQQATWLKPEPWPEASSKHQLFIPRQFFYFPDDNAVRLVTGDLMVGGLPYSWLQANGLPVNDLNVAMQDSDGDGFSNKLEFENKTDPRDTNDHPPYGLLLRLKSYSAKPFRMTLQSKNLLDGQEVYQLKLPDATRKRSVLISTDGRFDKTGFVMKPEDTGPGFKVVAFRQKSGKKKLGGEEVDADVSELELLDEKTQRTIVLVLNEEQDVPEVSAAFILLIPNLVDQPVLAQVGETFTFTLPEVEGQPARLIRFILSSATANGATVRHPDDKKEENINLFRDEDLSLVAKP